MEGVKVTCPPSLEFAVSPGPPDGAVPLQAYKSGVERLNLSGNRKLEVTITGMRKTVPGVYKVYKEVGGPDRELPTNEGE